jgi:GC-rich sequence DNA-binding factor
MKVLNKPEGDVGDLDDIDGIFEGNDNDDGDVDAMDDTQRSVKLMLRSGVIPDSTMIHAARKRRQMAREMGTPGDYISLNAAENGTSNLKSRLVRDDENDASDDSGTEDPHIVSMDRNKTRAESERQKNRDRFLELEQGSDNDEDDEEFRRFEHEQIRKGVSSKISAMSSINKLASSSSKSQVGVIRRKIFSYALI